VDALMKKEFDTFRLSQEPHPIMTMYGVEAIPFRHPNLADWRDTPQGIRSLHGPTNIELFGIVDDIWVHTDGSLAVVDYKATSTSATITLDDRDGYKRQLEVYQWLLCRNGFTVSNTGYFVFVNGVRDRSMFDRKLEFTMSVLPYEGSSAWVEDALIGVKECLMSDMPPPSTNDCEWCAYRKKCESIEK
jgi:RecB family exonuclease